MKLIVLYISIVFASGVLFVNIYNSIVDTTAWGAHFPESIQTTRNYYQTVNPGTFFRVFSPVNQVLALLSLILFWKTSVNVRIFLLAAFILYVLGDVFTFAYFYPRNDIMFKSDISTNLEAIKTAWKQWVPMNWLRSLIILIGLASSFIALHKISSALPNL
ncbi:MAG TPA: DUF1772 domain-containing protein [Hanamia sp.]|jgi:Domain of unknown function (DUF1772)|nr:DUF1772 domain-containing protein [Hanamia sp.]